MKLLEVLQGLDYEVLKGNTDTEIREIQNDSRKVQPGDLFFCISGAVSDGHTYAEDVAAKGAAVIVVEKPVNVPDTVTVIRVKSTRNQRKDDNDLYDPGDAGAFWNQNRIDRYD